MGVRSLFLNSRVATVRQIVERHLPEGTEIRFGERSDYQRVQVVKKTEPPPSAFSHSVLLDVTVFDLGKPIVRHVGKDRDKEGACKAAAHAIARDIKKSGSYFGDVLVQDPNYIPFA